MSKSNSIFELTVIGMPICYWGVIAGMILLGPSLLPLLFRMLQEMPLLMTLAVLAACYSTGIVVDRLATFWVALYNPKKLFQRGYLQRKLVGEGRDPRITLLAKADKALAVAFVESIRSRARILRAGLINILLCTVTTAWWSLTSIWPAHSLQGVTAFIAVSVLGLLTYGLVFFILGSFEAGYEVRARQVLSL